MELTEEHKRLQQCDQRLAHWKRWGPFLSERAWGTIIPLMAVHGIFSLTITLAPKLTVGMKMESLDFLTDVSTSVSLSHSGTNMIPFLKREYLG